MIDHGASLYFHHAWQNWEEKATRPFELVRDHVLLARAADLEIVDREFRAILNADLIRSIVNLIPEQWLGGVFPTVEEHRQAYVHILETRINNTSNIEKESQNARKGLI